MDETHGYGKGHIISGTCFNPCAPFWTFLSILVLSFLLIILPVLMLTV